MVATRRFLKEKKAQASALDILLFALLVSLATWMLTAYGAQDENAAMDELRGRYAMDLAQSFALSSRYVGSSGQGIVYTIGPGSLCSGDVNGAVYRLSKVVNASMGRNPLERTLNGSMLDLIADDLYLSLSFRLGEAHYSPSNSLLSGCFHNSLDVGLRKYISYFTGGAFDYKIDAIWRPFEGGSFDSLVYSNLSYGSEVIPSDTPVYVTEFQLAVPADDAMLSRLHDASSEFLKGYQQIKDLISNIETMKYGGIIGTVPTANESGYSINERARVTIKMWPKKAA